MKLITSFTVRKRRLYGVFLFFFLLNFMLSAQITGTVWEDLPFDGAVLDPYGVRNLTNEPGVQGVTVTAYPSGVSVMTGADGSWSIAGTTGDQRIEFSGWPAYMQPSVDAAAQNTSVRFVAANQTAVDFGLHRPSNFFDQPIPPFVAPRPIFGDQSGHFTETGVLLRCSYDEGGVPPNMTGADVTGSPITLAEDSEIGTTFGLAFSRQRQTIYMASFMKRYAGFGPSGPGAIYMMDPLANNTPTLFTNITMTGTDPHPADMGDAASSLPCSAMVPPFMGSTGYCYFYDPESFDKVGYMSFGDMDISEDEEYLWVVNLFTHELLQIDIDATTPAVPAVVNTYALPVPSECQGTDKAVGGGIGIKDGRVFVGVVATASDNTIANQASRLVGHVYELVGGAFVDKAVVPFSFTRGCLNNDGHTGGCPSHYDKDWEAWSDAENHGLSPASEATVYPQPWIMDLDFDGEHLIVGVRDRNGDQYGAAGSEETPGNDDILHGTSGGDVLFMYYDAVADDWKMESDGGPPAGLSGPTTANVDAGQGPGGREFFDDSHWNHRETSQGTIAKLPGKKEILLSVYDPWVDTPGGLDQFWDQGVVTLSTVDGSRLREMRFRNGSDPRNGFAEFFSKANGVGDLEAISAAAPIEIGNRVWLDTDSDGVQDADEAGIQGVSLDLLDAGGAVLETAITDAQGNYIFSSAAGTNTDSHRYGIAALNPNTAYTVRIANAAGGSQQAPLAASSLVLTDTGMGEGANMDMNDSDGAASGNDANAPVLPIEIPVAGANNHTFDFGFRPPPPCPVPNCRTATVLKN